MLSREKFKECIKELKDLERTEEELNKILRKFCDDDGYISLNRHYNLAVKLLEESMEDRNGYISTYVYDTDFGRYISGSEYDITYELSNIKDLDKLYDYIVKMNNSKIFVISDTHFNHKI